MPKGWKKEKKYSFMCKICGEKFKAADFKAKLCDKCRSPKLCKCGCGEYTSSKGALYKAGHHHRGKTYEEIYGSKDVSCGYQPGNKNIAKRKDIREKIKIGVKNSYKNPELIQKRKDDFKGNNVFSSVSKSSQKFAWELYECLTDSDKKQCMFGDLNEEFILDDYITNSFYRYDFTLINKKLIIEFHGDFWHMNPSEYKETDIHIKTRQQASEIWEVDRQKRKIAETNGFKYFVVWERDENKIEKSLNFINT